MFLFVFAVAKRRSGDNGPIEIKADMLYQAANMSQQSLTILLFGSRRVETCLWAHVDREGPHQPVNPRIPLV